MLDRDDLEVRHVRTLASRPARPAEWPDWLPPGSPVRTAAEEAGIPALWDHQAAAADALAGGRHLVLTTGTASGKSLAYLLPAATAGIGADPRDVQPVRWRRRPATSLYLAPTKALAHDQARVCAELAVPGWRFATVDGDTDVADRQWARDHAHHVLTNPDLVHASLLPNHPRWASFLRSLRYVVVDEAHRYTGVFGAQVAAVLRRLRRIAARYGADPTFAVVSATAPEAVATAAALTGIAAEDLQEVSEDGSPRGPVRISLGRALVAPEAAAAELLADLVQAGQQVLTFAPSRRLAEEIARAAARRGGIGDDAVVAYRAGYLSADRRVIERGLADGTVRGVAATNALELGVDIAGLDTVVLCGYPGSRAAFWQQAGRAGRRTDPADVVLIARPTPLDAYLLDHPEALLDEPVETPVLDPSAPQVLGPQLAAAAQELPLRPGDEDWFGAGLWPLVSRLTDLGLLRQRPDGWYWTASRRAVDRITLRSTELRTLDIIEEPTGRVLGTVGSAAADLVVHPGAIYLHQGDTYLCDELDVDVESGEAFVRPARPGYLTQPMVETDVRPAAAERQRPLGTGRLACGQATVRSTVTGFLRRDELTGRIWDSTRLDRPARVLATTATVFTVPAGAAEASSSRFDAGLHGLEHLLLGLLPAVVANDRADIGAHSWTTEDDLGMVAVFDRQPGSGFAARAYQRADRWLDAARDRIERCPCVDGCPRCILTSGCTSSQPLDKSTCRALLLRLVSVTAESSEPPDAW